MYAGPESHSNFYVTLKFISVYASLKIKEIKRINKTIAEKTIGCHKMLRAYTPNSVKCTDHGGP